MKLVITGGGTGGHIFGGVAIAEEFLKRNPKNEVLFIGAASGLEAVLVPKAGYRLETLRLGKLVGQSILKKMLTLAQLPLAILKCVYLLKKFKAQVVIGVGGYAAGPCLIAGRILGLKTAVLEQNSVAGFTNRLSAKLSNKVFLAFEKIPKGFDKTKCIYTGNPVRSTFKINPGKKDEPFTVFAFGGSQGATGINKLLTEAVKILDSKNYKFEVYHQTGPKDVEWVQKTYENRPQTHVFAFIHDMQSMYDKASLVICRAGSGTISELGATANAPVFIPFPFAAGNHQEVNARLVEEKCAGRVLVQFQAQGRDLAAIIEEYLKNPEKLSSMRKNMTHFYRSDAARRIIDELL